MLPEQLPDPVADPTDTMLHPERIGYYTNADLLYLTFRYFLKERDKESIERWVRHFHWFYLEHKDEITSMRFKFDLDVSDGWLQRHYDRARRRAVETICH